MADTAKIRTKSLPFEVSSYDPFEKDALNRKEFCEGLENFIQNSTTPYTLAINAGWGNGKTFLLQMLRAYLENQGFRCILFDAWKADFYDNALPALIGEIKRQIGTSDDFDEKTKELGKVFLSWGAVPKIVAALSKTFPAGTEIIGTLSQVAQEAWQDHDSVEHYLEYQRALKGFKKSLEKFASISTDGKPLVILVDELDRCRPDFALDVLEKTKHIFDVESVFFVFGLNKKELEKTIETVYGQIDAEQYLRRFFDEAINLVNRDNLLNQTMNEIGLTGLLQKRKDPHMIGDDLQLIDYLNLFSGMFNLSLRDQEQILASIKITLSMTALQERACPILLFYFTIVKLINPGLFQKSQIGTNPENQSSFPYEEHLRFYRDHAGFDNYKDIYTDSYEEHKAPYILLNAIYYQHNHEYKKQVMKAMDVQGDDEYLWGHSITSAVNDGAIPDNIGSFIDKIDSVGKLIPDIRKE